MQWPKSAKKILLSHTQLVNVNIQASRYTLHGPKTLYVQLIVHSKVKTISNDQELIQSDPTSCPQNQKGNN